MPRAARKAKSDVLKSDPQWYKDAIIYQVHVRAFYDSNGDGIGDFRGLTEKLDYIQDLGVTAIWLQPFFPSPLRDDGYDIADYANINPIYGNLRDFKTFLREAHKRGLRVITEMVINHTSDQHEWFQRARTSPPGSKYRDWYVWSDTPDKYQEARIIFQDFETSNWTWDHVAGAYFWHRFYSHQPDLNFDNPDVREATMGLLDFWLDMGVDGLRLDAIPYLYQREGTNCENLPETHAYLKKLRHHVDRKYKDRMLLAEANQWPEDAAAYFGDGDECHMNFHFPLMPRLFMAVVREDRFPILDILEQTPSLPDVCQWGIFLRNHDELTLEMVTDEERDYMYRAYAEDPESRVNLGIRRRLAPLLKNNRRKIELMIGLLLSHPGTPILYYGDEIGMGDNIYLGDRNGVRTPMQWNADRNAGFSRANPQKLYLPVVIDGEYHYATRNVEIDQHSPHSLLWWMRRIIKLRKQTSAFGRGTIEFLRPENPKVLAYLREYADETLLVVANLSRFVQCAELDLSRYRGRTPIEMFGQTSFPAIGQLPYFLTLAPYGFYWFRLKWQEAEQVELAPSRLPSHRAEGNLEKVFQGKGKEALENALLPFVTRHRWFAGKARTAQGVKLLDSFIVGVADDAPVFLLMAQVDFLEGDPDVYLTPVVLANEERAENILADHPGAGVMALERPDDEPNRTVCEATWEKEFWQPLLRLIVKRRSLSGRNGVLATTQTSALPQLDVPDLESAEPAVHGGEQSNTSAMFGGIILKMIRRVRQGVNPEQEIGKFLTDKAPLEHVPKLGAAIEYRPASGEAMTVAVLHERRDNEGDAWVWTLDELGRFFERVASEEIEDGESAIAADRHHASLFEAAQTEPPEVAVQMIGSHFLQAAELLGRRTAQMHAALASNKTDADFRPEPFSKLYQRGLYQSLRTQAKRNFDLLRKQAGSLPESVRPTAERALSLEKRVLDHYGQIIDRKIDAMRIRCHGDYHLGQILFTGKDFIIIDFEGEPERTLGERRIKTSPLKDVAGMLRSFHYAAHSAKEHQASGIEGIAESIEVLDQWRKAWMIWTTAAFWRAYNEEITPARLLPDDPEPLKILLEAHVLEKAVYELGYELNNRPKWVNIPLEGILSFIENE